MALKKIHWELRYIPHYIHLAIGKLVVHKSATVLKWNFSY